MKSKILINKESIGDMVDDEPIWTDEVIISYQKSKDEVIEILGR
jgi:hypothetical protein